MKPSISKTFILLALLIGTGFHPYAQTNEATDKYFEISKNLEIYTNLFKELNIYYVDPIEPGLMTKTGIDAMLKGLDPYTNFISEAEIEDFEFQTSGRYGGIGTGIRIDDDSNVVIADPIEGSPVDKAGIRAGDIIVSIDGHTLKGKTEEQFGPLLKGSSGTTLTMVIQHPFTGEHTTHTIQRQEINISSVPYFTLLGNEKNIAYASLTQFTPNCSRDLQKALDSLKEQSKNLKGVVLDLRGNPGGLLSEAVSVCNLFLDRGQLVVSTKGKNADWNKEFHTNATAWNTSIPLVVLINHSSASASEIVSGTIQDLDRGVVIGTRSYGKGLVQIVRPLGYNTQLKVTTAKYYTPSGRCIQAIDYSHRNEDGSVAIVPDSLKKPFKTKNGRLVYDGGGVEPDVKTENVELSNMLQTLLAKGYIFDYATKYYHEHSDIAPPQEFRLSDAEFNAFVTWLSSKDYSYQTASERKLQELKEQAEAEKSFNKIRTEFNALAAKLAHDKKRDIAQHAAEVSRVLAAEIAGRYYYQKGRVINRLYNGDQDVQQALSLLDADGSKYNEILK